MRKESVWKQALALVLSAAMVFGNVSPVSAAAGDTAGSAGAATGGTAGDTQKVTDDNAYKAVTFDFEDGVQQVSGDDAIYTENGIKFINDGVEIVDAPVVSGDNAQHGKALKFSRTKQMTVDGSEVTTGNSHLTTVTGELSKYDFSNGFTLSMDIYPDAQRDWDYLFGFGIFGEKWVCGTIGFVAAFGEPWTFRFPHQNNGWLEGNEVSNNHLYFGQEENAHKWYKMDYVYTNEGLTIKVNGVPTVAYSIGEEEIKGILQEASEGQIRIGMGTALENEGFLGYMDNVTLAPVAPHQHIYGDKVIKSQAPTCTVDGWEQKECTECGVTATITIPARGHIYGDIVAVVNPTCTTYGYEAHYVCTRTGCSQWAIDDATAESGKKEVTRSQIQIDKLGHKYEYTTTKATDAKDGVIRGVCKNDASHTTEEIIPKASNIALVGGSSYTYTGKKIAPQVTVKDSAGKDIAAANYTVSYGENTKAGTGTVTVTFKGDKYEGSVTKSFTITAAASLKLNKTKVTLYTGKASKTITIKPTVTGASKTVAWTTSNKKVATVKNGKITAVGKGTATITAKANGITQTVKVTVKNPTITIKNGKKAVKKNTVTVKKKKSVKLTVSVSPKNSGSAVKALSKKDKKIATVSYKKGKLTIKGKKKGTVKVKITSGKTTKTLTVKVK